MAQRVLITRPVENAAALTQLLLARGYDVIHEPMFSIRFLSRTVDIADLQAVLLTSANGARALAAATAARSVKVFAVGHATGRACHKHGFNDVIMAGGTVADLARLVITRLRPENGALLHVAGSVSAGDLSGQLRQAGFVVRKTILYDAHPTTTLAKSQLIADGAIDAALFYSPRSAAIFAALVNRAGVGQGLAASCAYCLSEPVRCQLSELPWRLVRVASAPNQESLLAALDHDQTTTFLDNTSGLAPKAGEEEDMTRHNAQDESMSRVRNAQSPPPVTSLEADSHSQNGISVSGGTDRTQKVPKVLEEKSYRNLAALLIGAILLVVTSVFVGWMSQAWWRDSVPDTYVPVPTTVPTTGNDSLGMELQRSLTALRHDLDEVVSQLDEQRQSHKVLEQQMLLQKNSVFNSRDENTTTISNNNIDIILKRVAKFEATITELTNTETRRLESLTHQTTALESRLNSVGTRIDTIAREQVSAVRLAEMHNRLTALEETIANLNSTYNTSNTSPKWLLAITQLRDAVDRGTPFTAELHAARALAVAEDAAIVDQAVTGFIPYAATGLPTNSALTTRFEKLHSTIARVAPSPEGDSWLARVLQRLQGAITIRRTDGSTAAAGDEDGTLIVMAKASTALNAGDFWGAIRVMESLRGKPAEVASGWMTFARARAAADEALSRLTAHALGRTAASPVKE